MAEDGIAHLILENAQSQAGKKKEFQPDKRLYSDVTDPNANQGIENLVAQEKQRGYQQGYNEALAKVQSEWECKLSQLDELLQVLEQPFKDIDHEIQSKTLEISLAIAKQIIRRELSIDSGQIVSAVKTAIDLIPKDGQQIDIYINPNDEQHIQNIFSQNNSSNKFNIIQDPTISVGGCRASTDYSLVDLTIEKQIATIATQLFGEQRKNME